MLLRELSKHLARIVSINFLRPVHMGTLCMPRFILPLIFRLGVALRRAMLLRAFDRMLKREGEME